MFITIALLALTAGLLYAAAYRSFTRVRDGHLLGRAVARAIRRRREQHSAEIAAMFDDTPRS
jgi:hypothetical protein